MSRKTVDGKKGEWLFWRWQHIADLSNPDDIYLSRLHIFRTPWGGVQLHWIRRPDADRALHNHPRKFFRLILRGGYTEAYQDGAQSSRRFRTLTRGKYGVVDLQFFHRITDIRDHTVSLVVVGPKHQEWGFLSNGVFVPWEEYTSQGYVGG